MTSKNIRYFKIKAIKAQQSELFNIFVNGNLI